MNGLVHAHGNFPEHVSLGHVFQFVYPFVHRSAGTEVHMPLVSEDANLHVVQVVLFVFLPRWIVALLLELLSLQVIARVVLVTERQGYDV